MLHRALAIDIGASGGRHIIGEIRDGKLVLTEVYRFKNAMKERGGRLYWDTEELFTHILAGMKECAGTKPDSVGIDTWGVDYVLVDKNGDKVREASAYRDGRTKGMDEKMDARMPFAAQYARTGIARQPFNTLYQLMSEPADALARADRCLLMPDYFHYRLCGRMASEYTAASTTALLNAQTGDWDGEIMRAAGIPSRLFPEKPMMPCTVLGSLKDEIARAVGYSCKVILPASHDTGSAFMAVPARDENAVTLSSGTWSLLGVELSFPLRSERALSAGFTNEGGYGGKIRFLQNIMGLWILQSLRRESGDLHSFSQMADMALANADYTETFDVSDSRFLAPASMKEAIFSSFRERNLPPPDTEGRLYACVNRSLAACYKGAISDLSAITGRRFTSLNIVGGGSQSEVLNRWTAESTGLPVCAGPTEGTALGNLIAQLIAFGDIENLTRAREMIRSSFPIKVYGGHQDD